MLRKTILLGIFLIILVNSINAQTQKELADGHYELAVEAHNNGDCKNASVHVSRAFDLYTQIGDIVGETKCNELILKINNCLGPRGDNQYIQALDSYTKGEDYLNSGDYKKAREQFDMALISLYNANSSYQHMLPPDPSRIDKINVKYGQINEKIIKSELVRADDLYIRALGFFQKEDPIAAKSYVINASVIYTKYNDSEGVKKCQYLLDRILDVIGNLKERANYLYESGVNAYTSANCTNEGFFEASDHFEEARDTYLLINDYDSALNCEYILNQTNQRIEDCIQIMLETVNKLIEEANTQFVLAKECEDYDTAEEIANKAKGMSQDLYGRFGYGIFNEKVVECEELIRKINAGRDNLNRTQNAEELYNTAVRLFTAAEYENANVLVKNARDIFERTGDWGGVTKCDRLIDDIDVMLGLMREAEGYYNTSLEYYKIADYENATIYVETAKGIYTNISRIREVSMCNSTLEDINKGNKTKNNANQYYEEALRYLDYREYGTARADAEEALRLYKKINYAKGIKKAEDLIKRIPEPPQPWTQVIIGPLIIVTVLFIIFMWGRERIRKRKKEREDEEKKIREEEARESAEIEAEKMKREKEKEKMETERRRIREMVRKEEEAIGKEKKAVKGEVEEPPPVGKKLEDRDKLREMIKMDEEAIGRERRVVEGEVEWDRDKLKEIVEKGKETIGREKRAVEEAVLGPEAKKTVKDKSKFEKLIEEGIEAIGEEKRTMEEIPLEEKKLEEPPPEMEETPRIEEKVEEERARIKEMIEREKEMIRKEKKAVKGEVEEPPPVGKKLEDRDKLREMIKMEIKTIRKEKRTVKGEGEEEEESSSGSD